MTRRDRIEHRLAKRQDWAQKAEAKSEQRFTAVHELADSIPFGQPILVGHHSEGRARRDAERIFTGMGKAVELHNLSQHHSQKADGLAHQLDRSIFTDDTNAVGALEARIAQREAKAERMTAVNKAWRKSKGDIASFARLAEIPEILARTIAETIADRYSFYDQPHPGWELSNLRANIRRDKERLGQIQNCLPKTLDKCQ